MRRRWELAPVFSTSDVPGWLAHYQRLGFSVEADPGGAYGFAWRDGIELHVSHRDDHDPALTAGAAFLRVPDADALHAAWKDVGEGRDVAPADTDYGLREGAHVDPDGNLPRFAHRL